MNNLCVFCGEELDDKGLCMNTHTFKKMCLNCEWCENMTCQNEDNKKKALKKMLETLKNEGGGYAVKTLEIEPLPLKKPTLKCQNWTLSAVILNKLPELFV